MNSYQNNIISFKDSIKVINNELVWMIGNISDDRIKPNQSIISPSISVGSKDGLSSTLQLFPNDTSEFFSLTLYLKSVHNRSSRKFWAYIKCQVLQDNNVLACSTAVGTFFWNQNNHTFHNFVRRLDLENRERLVICCYIHVLGHAADPLHVLSIVPDITKNIEAFAEENKFKKEINVNSIIEKSSRMYCKHLQVLSIKSCDVILISHEEEYPAHRNILASYSIIFSALFIHRAEENACNRIIINDMYPGVLREMLCFIYTKKIKNFELIPNVLEAACKYEVEHLKTLCERILFNSTNTDNVCSILLLADLYHLESLKNWAMLVIRAYADVIVQTPGFEILKNSKRVDIMAEIIRELALTCK